MALYPNNKNPFFAEEETEECSFSSDHFKRKDPFMENADNEVRQIQQLREQSMNRQLDSTKRAMASIYDSEAIGVTTAEELVLQGEQLDNVETKLDQMNQDMKTSQRHINNIKSIFGGIKNWWSGNKGGTAKEPVNSEKSSRLQGSLEHSAQSQPQGPHPAFKMQSDDPRGFYEDDTAISSKSRALPQAQGFSSETATNRDNEWRQYEKQLDSNMDELSSGLSRLKNLGVGLGDEIERQNAQVDRISSKAERADVTLGQQNKQMRHLLK